MQFYGISLMRPYKQSDRWQDVIDTNKLSGYIDTARILILSIYYQYQSYIDTINILSIYKLIDTINILSISKLYDTTNI
jgi:hypothetical protein